MNLEEFKVVDFQPRSSPGFVYILCYGSGEKQVPFYVGETQAIWGRLNDYYWAQFQASTDFRVGETAKYLHAKGLQITARYRASDGRRKEERSIISELRTQGVELLNDMGSYNYETAKEDEERARIQSFVDRLVSGSDIRRATNPAS